jgi:hypothetical protein
MKAYYLSIANDDVGVGAIVFANTASEAKKQVYGTDLADYLEEWVDLRARRDKRYDDMENLSADDLITKMWRDGWQWLDLDTPDPYETTDDEFLQWHKENNL